MPHLDVIKDQVREFCGRMVEGSDILTGILDDRSFLVLDDGLPEGGVLVNVTYTTHVDLDRYEDWAHPPAKEEELKRVAAFLFRKVQFWSNSSERTCRFTPQEDGTITAAFYYLPVLTIEEYGRIALKVWKGRERADYAYSNYEDEVMRIKWDGKFLETVKLSNHNPTTYIRFDGKATLGECIRHHGEHCYLVKHLLKLDSESDPPKTQ